MGVNINVNCKYVENIGRDRLCRHPDNQNWFTKLFPNSIPARCRVWVDRTWRTRGVCDFQEEIARPPIPPPPPQKPKKKKED